MYVSYLNHTIININNYIRKMVSAMKIIQRFLGVSTQIYFLCDDYKVISGKSAFTHEAQNTVLLFVIIMFVCFQTSSFQGKSHPRTAIPLSTNQMCGYNRFSFLFSHNSKTEGLKEI